MSNSESDDAEKRKQKLEVLRAKRLDQESAKQDIKGDDDSDSGQGGMRDRWKKALVKRRQAGGEAGAATTRGLKEMSADNENAPRKKGAMKKRAMKKMAMKKRAMKKMAMKKRAMAMKKRGGGQRGEEKKVDASSTLEEISKHRSFLEERINKLKSTLADRTAELQKVIKLEAAKSKQS